MGLPALRNARSTAPATGTLGHVPRVNLPIYVPATASTAEFVRYWSAQYDWEGDEVLYSSNIGRALTRPSVRQLYEWKNKSRLSAKKLASVERNYIARIAELDRLPRSTSPNQFLGLFSAGGAIWRIFWLHCWQPTRFPIYDQHVHRAMSSIQTGEREEIDRWDDEPKVDAYVTRYLPFHAMFEQQDQRNTDRALWAFGKFLKSSKIPEAARAHVRE